MSVRIGVTGPIGCGKSTIAAWLRDMGGVVIDADALAREVTMPEHEDWPTLADIRDRFGDAVFRPDGSLDRPALAERVFSEPVALADLEAIVHPAVRWLALKRLREAEESGAPFVVIEAIKLVEGRLGEQCDEIWLVECSAQTQRERLRGRGLAPDDVDRRLATQGDIVDRLAPAATRRLVTDGPPEAVRADVERLLADALAAAASRPPRVPIVGLVEYDAEWPRAFEDERARIAAALGADGIAIEHMGSTSVPGLPAKPKIDIIAVVPRTPLARDRRAALVAQGYAHRGALGITGRDLFTRAGPRSVNLHIYDAGNPEIERHLTFRDYLRAHPEQAARYADMKRRVAATARDIDVYTEAKSPLIRELEEAARAWRAERQDTAHCDAADRSDGGAR